MGGEEQGFQLGRFQDRSLCQYLFAAAVKCVRMKEGE